MTTKTGLNLKSQEEFAAQVEPYHQELLVHCYRMMGSLQDGEDMLQETLLRAWNRRESFEGRGTLRAWLYRIATNMCLDELKKRSKRIIPEQVYPAANPAAPFPPPITEPVWLEPIPDEMLPFSDDTPEKRYSQQESISLAFLTALHLLAPQQRAVLILKDVLDWRSKEVAALLDQSVSAVNSALYRARINLAKYQQSGTGSSGPNQKFIDDLLNRYVIAWETADIEGFTALLREDAQFTMPPFTCWYAGQSAIRAMVDQHLFAHPDGDLWKLLPTKANRQPAFGLYQRAKDGKGYQPFGLMVIQIQKEKIAGITAFLNPALSSRFGLPGKL